MTNPDMTEIHDSSGDVFADLGAPWPSKAIARLIEVMRSETELGAIKTSVDYYATVHKVDLRRFVDVAESLAADRDRIAKERDDADRRAGDAERRLAYAEETIKANSNWINDQKRKLGYSHNASFDDVWDAVIARAEKAEGELVAAKRMIPDPMAHHHASKEAAGRYGLEPGCLAHAWICGDRTDNAEIEWAIVDGLAQGGWATHPGDGVGVVGRIVRHWKDRAEKAEAERDELETEIERRAAAK